jgi:hypothetical protein
MSKEETSWRSKCKGDDDKGTDMRLTGCDGRFELARDMVQWRNIFNMVLNLTGSDDGA